MKYIISGIMFVDAVLAFEYTVRLVWSRERRGFQNRIFAFLCFSSGIWSAGFSMLYMQTDVRLAYHCRNIAMIGLFGFLIGVQTLVCMISEMEEKWKKLMIAVALLGIPVYFMSIDPDVTVYYLTDIGMSYHFNPGIVSVVYTAYMVVMEIDILLGILYMIFVSKSKRIRKLGKEFLVVETVIIFGMVLNTILPLIGIRAVPGSSMTQFWGLLIIYHGLRVTDRATVNIDNMSEHIYYSLEIPILVYDNQRKLKIMNDTAAAFFGVEEDRRRYQNSGLGELFEIEEKEAFPLEERHRDIDAVCVKNRAYCSLAVNRISDGYGDMLGYIVVVSDLSERMKAMQKLEDATREAEAANKAKSMFLANMSHEIRTPMNAIIGFAELALKMDLEETVREYFEDIKKSSKNLLAVINDILDISKIESGKMELVCSGYYISGLFNDVFLIMSAQAKKKGLAFGIDVDPQIPNKLYGDKVRMRGIFINLLNNAVKYTEKGSVRFSAKVLARQGDLVKLEFKIADTGIGINPEEKERLFESFSQVDYKLHYDVEGSGLGLAIVKGYVQLMDGDISVESVYGEGTVFTVVLDQKVLEAEPMKQSYTEGEDFSKTSSIGNMKVSGVHALVVDDSRINLRVAAATLKHYGLLLDTASGGREAIELCRKNKYRLIFMDQMMPEMDGIAAMKQIRALDPVWYGPGGTCRIIVLTANAVNGVRDQLLAEGFDEYLGKPMNYRRLEQLLTEFLPAENIETEAESS